MPDEEGIREMGEKGEEIKKEKSPVIKKSRECKVHTGNGVNDIGITMCDDRWVLGLLSRGHLLSYINV